MLESRIIQDWIESVQPLDDPASPQTRPIKRARHNSHHPASRNANATELEYDPALFAATLQTPPGTDSMQTGQKRGGDAMDKDKDSESGIVSMTDVSEFRIPSLPPSRLVSRPTTPTKPPIKTLADLEMLKKPVFRHKLATGTLPADVQPLYVAIRKAVFHRENIIPKEVEQQVSSVMGQDETRSTFFRAPESAGGAVAAEVTLAKLLYIVEMSESSTDQGRHELAWNNLVHTPMLLLAFGNSGSQVAVEPIMTATIAKNSVPTLQRRVGAGEDTASLLAWSPQNSNSVTQSGDWNRPLESNSHRTKVDYVLAAEISDPTLKSVIHTTVLNMGLSGYGTHFNATECLPLRYNPVAVTIETKLKASVRDPLLQLGVWVAAWHERMAQVRTFRCQETRVTASERQQLFTTKLVSVPLVVVTSDEWEVYFACDNQSPNQSCINIYGPISLGSTDSLLGAYMVLASLEAIGEWIRTIFCPSMKTWMLVD